MTARRRRKTGTGPSATALIAWVGGAQLGVGEPASAQFSVIEGGSCGRVSGGRAVIAGRACGFAAGTLLACGSVLAGTAYVGDSSLAGDSAPLLRGTSAVPVFGAGTLDAYPGPGSAGRAPAVPDMVRAQAVAGSNPAPRARLGRVRRNTPVSLDLPAEPNRDSATAQRLWNPPVPSSADPAPSGPVASISPLLGPTAKRVGRVAPVDGVLTPTNPPEKRVGSPASQPAMAMLTSVLPLS